MNNKLKSFMLVLLVALVIGCQKEKDDYLLQQTEEYVDKDLMSLLKEVPEYTKYVELLEQHNIDSMFDLGKTMTMFIPTNDAVESIEELYLDTIDLIQYLTIESYVNLITIDNPTKLKTYSGKFMEVAPSSASVLVDGIEVSKAGPLCKNGKYYEINSIIEPKPNLFEYIDATNPFFRDYILRQDSISLDLELSTPISINEYGQTVYDSVLYITNLFEEEYFPISEEFRTQKATMLLFDQEQFDNALAIIADDLGLSSVEAIPDQWKEDILLPYLSYQGVFWNELDYEDFASGRIRNIKGDTINIDPSNIDASSEFECSNGKVFSYLNFTVPDSLYKGSTRIQGESLIIPQGTGFAWSPEVTVTGASVIPDRLFLTGYDNDSVLVVPFGDDYDKEFSLSFKFDNIFPGKYQLLFKAKNKPSGVFEILVNGEVQDINLGYGSHPYIDLYDLRNVVRSNVSGVFRPDAKGFNCFDILVDNITEYGQVEVTIRYVEPGQKSDNGFQLDYIDLISYTE